MLAVTLRLARRDARYRFLAVTSAPVLLFFFAVMTRVPATPNLIGRWTGTCRSQWPQKGWLDARLGRRERAAKAYLAYLKACAGLSAVAAVVAAVYVASPGLLRLLPASIYRGNADPSSEVFGWDRVRDAVTAEASLLGPAAVVVSHHNVLCGHLAAALDDRPPVYCASPRRTEFDFLGRRDPPAAAPIVYVESDRYPAEPASILPGRSCALVRTLDIERGDHLLNQFRIYDCLGSDGIEPRALSSR